MLPNVLGYDLFVSFIFVLEFMNLVNSILSRQGVMNYSIYEKAVS